MQTKMGWRHAECLTRARQHETLSSNPQRIATMRLRLFALAATVTSALFAYGCSNDSATAPSSAAPSEPSQALLGTLLGQSTTVTPLLRTTPLASSLTVTAVVGP